MNISLRDLLEIGGGGTMTWLWTAAAKHWPPWTDMKTSPSGAIYEWARATVQEVANQRSGGGTLNPIYPALREPDPTTLRRSQQ
jgi:hypothetical protein